MVENLFANSRSFFERPWVLDGSCQLIQGTLTLVRMRKGGRLPLTDAFLVVLVDQTDVLIDHNDVLVDQNVLVD